MKDYQTVLFPYAYNILGSAEDAKDAIQDVILNYTLKEFQPENEKNYLIKGVVNKAINLKRRKKRTQEQSTWLPEPLSTETSDLGIELRELVSFSLLYLLERLNPKERAVFILKEAFAYSHEEIADVLSITIEHSRKLLSRAHSKVNQPVHQKTKDLKVNLDQLNNFISAIREKDLPKLHNLLSDEISYYSDGGTKVKVVKKFCTGVEEVADLLIYVFHKYQKKMIPKPALINHQPAVLYYYRDKITSCQVFEIDETNNKIVGIKTIVDPKKLVALQQKQNQT